MPARAKRISSPKIPAFLASEESAYRWLMKNADTSSFADDDSDPDSVEEYVRSIASDYQSFAEDAYEDGEIRVWRALELPVLEGGDLDLKIDCLGKAWSFKKSGAGVYNAVPHKGRPTRKVVLEGVVSPADVDWSYGFISYSYYGESQSEVSMNSDAPVLLVAVNDRPLPEPVLGNTGDAREAWGESVCSSSRSGLRTLGLAKGRAARSTRRR